MTVRMLLIAGVAIAAAPVCAQARSLAESDRIGGGAELPVFLQCVPYAREVTGIRIYGDAYTWWQQAEGRYGRGKTPRVGAVMAFRPYANSQLGHVAAISKIIDSRTVLLRHANWSVPGQIEDNVQAVDVSDNNDWSEVRVWYGPSGKLGTTRWPVTGFIYRDRAGKDARVVLASTSVPKSRSAATTRTARARYADDPIGEIIAASINR